MYKDMGLTAGQRPSQSERLQVGRPPLLLHRHGTEPLPQASVIGPAGYSSFTVRCPGLGRDRTHRSTGACGPSQSERLQTGLPPLLMHRTGPRPPDRAAIGPAGHSSYTVSCHCDGPGRDRTQRSAGACGPSSVPRQD